MNWICRKFMNLDRCQEFIDLFIFSICIIISRKKVQKFLFFCFLFEKKHQFFFGFLFCKKSIKKMATIVKPNIFTRVKLVITIRSSKNPQSCGIQLNTWIFLFRNFLIYYRQKNEMNRYVENKISIDPKKTTYNRPAQHYHNTNSQSCGIQLDIYIIFYLPICSIYMKKGCCSPKIKAYTNP